MGGQPVADHILTEGSDFLDTEGSDRLITETSSGGSFSWNGLRTRAASPGRDTRRAARSRLGRPIVGAGIAFHGPGVRLAEPLSRNRVGRKTTRRLFPPAVVSPRFVAAPIKANLVEQPRRITRMRPDSRLQPPAVVGAGIAFSGPRKKLVRLSPAVDPRRHAKSILFEPQVVTPASTFVAAPIKVDLAPSNGRARKTHSQVAPPFVIAPAEGRQGGIGIQLAYSLRGRPRSWLRGPRDVFAPGPVVSTLRVDLARTPRKKTVYRLPTVIVSRAAAVAYPISVHLARRRPSAVRYTLRAPVVVSPVLARPTIKTFARIKPRPTTTQLSPPAVVAPVLARPIAEEVAVNLAKSVRPQIHSRLSRPTVVFPFIALPVRVDLARIRPAQTHAILRRPTDLVDQQDLGFVRVRLAYSRRGRPVYRLATPVVVGPVLARAIVTHLAPQLRGAPKSIVRAPAVVGPILAQPIRVTSARIRPPRTIARLKPPTVVFGATPADAVADITLAQIRPAKTHPFLRAPVVVTEATPYLRPTDVTFSYQSRGKAKPRLAPPTVVSPVLARAILVRLAPQKRGAPRSFLSLPVPAETFAPIHVEISVQLTRVVGERKTISRLFPPVAGRTAVELLGPNVTIVRIRPPRTTADVKPPTVIDLRPQTYFVSVTLAPSKRGTPKSRLTPPVFPPVAPPIHEEIAVQLTRARLERRLASSRLSPPAVIDNSPQTVFPSVTLAPQRRGVPKSLLRKPESAYQCLVTRFVSRAFLSPPAMLPGGGGSPPVTYAADEFTRTVSNGWGTADLGGTWTNTGSRWSTNGSRGEWTMTAGSTGSEGSYLGGAPGPVEATYRWTFQEPWAGNVNRIKFYIRADRTNGAAGYMLWLENGTSDRVQMQIRDAGESLFSPVATPWPDGNPDYGNMWWAKIRYDEGVLYAKAWKDGAAEPGWQIVWAAPPAPLGSDIAVGFSHFSTVTNTMVVDSITVGSPDDTCARGGGLVLPPPVRDRRPPVHSFLRPPTDTVGQEDQGRVETHLAYSLRGKPKSRLSRPTVVFAVALNRPEVTLAPQKRGTPKSKLFPPAVVGPVLARPTQVTLQRIRPAHPSSVLRPPAIVFSQTPADAVADITLVRIRPAGTHSRLFPPTVVFPFFARPTDVTLAPRARRKTRSFLAKPTDLVDQQDLGYLRAHLAYSRRGRPIFRLGEPIVVDVFRISVIDVHLAYSRRGTPRSFLRAPVVVSSATVVLRPTAVTLTRIRPVKTLFALQPPTVVLAAPLPPSSSSLAYSLRGKTMAILRKPVVIDVSPQVAYLDIHLAPSTRGKPKSGLAGPISVIDTGVLGGTLVQLAPQRRGQPKSFLSPPVPPETFPPVHEKIAVQLALAEVRQRKTVSRLSRPTVVFTAVELSGPETALAPSSRGKTKYFLRPMGSAAVVYAPLKIRLAPSTRIPRAPHFRLVPPTVIDNRPQTFYIAVALAYSLRGKAKPRLSPPPTIQATAKAETVLSVTFAYSLRGKPKSFLRAPVVVTAATPYLRAIDTTLVRIRPVRTLAILRRPTDLVDQQDLGFVKTHLAFSRRGRPKSRLFGVIYGARSYAPVSVTLAPQRRGKAKSFLAEKIYAARSYAPIRVLLAPSSRLARTPHSFIVPPTVVGAFTARPTVVSLAPQARPQAKSRLELVVYEARSFAPVKVVLASSPRIDRTPHSFLTPPTVVTPFFATPITVALARTPRIPIHQFLREPTLATPGFPGPTVTLSRIRPPRTVARIFPPAVVNPFVAPISTSISVTLAYSVRGRPIHHLGFVPGLSHGGIVCGVILDLTSVCQDITADADTIIPGGVLETHVVSEETTASTVIIGETLAETRVDQEIE